jgi:hypothetical protein
MIQNLFLHGLNLLTIPLDMLEELIQVLVVQISNLHIIDVKS